MINQQLLDYIKQQLQQNVGAESIKQTLLAQGWQAQDIDEALLQLSAPAVPAPPRPVPQMQQLSILDYFLGPLKKYAVFDGRASRREYWMFSLLSAVVSFLLIFIVSFVGVLTQSSNLGYLNIIVGLYTLGVLCPGMAVTVRRLHDTGRSGWRLLLDFIPLVGPIIVLVFLAQDSQPGENKYGPNPKSEVAYGKIPLWQWILLFFVISAAIYGFARYLNEDTVCCVVPTPLSEQQKAVL